MESKQMTLRSQTVQCPHCGEYYSVTYKYCPFCDAGRKAEARKKAARKQQATSLFTGLFSREDDAGMDVPVREAGQRRERQSSQHRERDGSQHREREGSRRNAYDESEPRSHQRPVQYEYDTPIPRSEGFRKKKTSEMTEEEKKAYRAEREARAAARKRERDRAARAAALTDLNEPGPAVPAAQEPVPQEAGPVLSPSGMETIEITIDPMSGAPADLSALITGQAAADAQSQDAAGQPETGTTAAPAEAAPVVEVPTPTPEVTPKTYDPSRILEGDSELDALLSEIRGLLDDGPSVPAQAAPAAAPAQAPLMDPQPVLEEMPLADAADLLPEEPVVTAGPTEGETAPAAEDTVPTAPEAPQAPEEAAQAEPEAAQAEDARTEGDQAVAAQTEEVQAEAGQSENVQAETSQAETELAEEAVSEGSQAEEVRAEEAAGADAQPAPAGYEDPELLWSAETIAAAAASAEKDAAAQETADPAQETAEDAREKLRQRRAAERQARQRKQQKTAIPLAPIIAAVVVVLVAALLVSKVIVPALQKPKEAESISLVQTQVILYEPDATETLTPVFEPERSSGEITWTCTDWNVVDVNPEGLLTAKAPGTAIVSAALANGSTASAEVVCAWGEEGEALAAAAAAAAAEGTESEAEPAVETAGLSATDLTLDAQGKTQQLTLNGVAGAVTWTSSKPSVATVSADGTVTAVSKGSATVTAEANGSKYNCNVRCVW